MALSPSIEALGSAAQLSKVISLEIVLGLCCKTELLKHTISISLFKWYTWKTLYFVLWYDLREFDASW